MTRERGIAMGGLSILALLLNHKIETRRVMKEQRPEESVWRWRDKPDERGRWFGTEIDYLGMVRTLSRKCPFGVAGDTLYVREAWKAAYRKSQKRGGALQVVYRADGRQVYLPVPEDKNVKLRDSWRPGRFMFKFMSRYGLRIVSITPQELHDIDDEAAIREGVFQLDGLWHSPAYLPSAQARHHDPVSAYRWWWDELHGSDPALEWAANPEVWAIRFDVFREDPKDLIPERERENVGTDGA